jgi:tetratricopeptide (TPR) repeat protein
MLAGPLATPPGVIAWVDGRPASKEVDGLVPRWRRLSGLVRGVPARNRALRAERAGDWIGAAQAWADAVGHDPARAGWHHRLGRARARSGDWPGAIAPYETALALDDRTRPRWIFRLGRAYEAVGRFREAADVYIEAIGLAATGEDPGRHARASWHHRLGTTHAQLRDWDRATDSFERAIALDPSHPTWYHQLGQARTKLRDWDRATAAYETALDLGGPRTSWLVQLGRSHERAGRLDDAREAYERAVALNPAHTPSHHRLGTVCHRLGRIDQARDAFLAGIATDPAALPFEHDMVHTTTWAFLVRRDVARFLAQHIDHIRHAATHPAAPTQQDPPTTAFIYWAQGFDTAPALVRRCRDELRRHHPHVIALDDTTLDHHTHIPPDIWRRVESDLIKRSNLVRLAVLARQGGVWVDATCLVSERLVDRLDQLLPSGFFAFRHHERCLSSWFLAARPANHLVSMLLHAHYTYWRHHRRSVHYHFFNMIFEALYHLDDQFAETWDATPTLPSDPAYALQRTLYDPHDQHRWQQLLDGSFVHKLTHKLQPERSHPRTTIAALLSQDGPI